MVFETECEERDGTLVASSVATAVDLSSSPPVENKKVIAEGELISYELEEGHHFGLAVVRLRDDVATTRCCGTCDHRG